MHILDLIMFFVCAFILWGILAVISGKQFTEELGAGLVGMPVMLIYTIVYIVLFAFWPDWNWSEFDWVSIKSWFKW